MQVPDLILVCARKVPWRYSLKGLYHTCVTLRLGVGKEAGIHLRCRSIYPVCLGIVFGIAIHLMQSIATFKSMLPGQGVMKTVDCLQCRAKTAKWNVTMS